MRNRRELRGRLNNSNKDDVVHAGCDGAGELATPAKVQESDDCTKPILIEVPEIQLAKTSPIVDESGRPTGRRSSPLPAELLERWQIIDFIGEGGMSSVYKARHVVMGKIAAIKLLHPHLALRGQSALRFQQEAKAVSVIEHPNVVAVHDCGLTEQGTPFMVMEYLEGESLSAFIQREGPLPAARALPIFFQICDALQHAHSKGIVHRDLKPSNVMLVGENREQVKIVDFGIAKVIPLDKDEANQMHQLTQTGEVFGSPLYMSPEQCLGAKLDSRSDIYSMGCLMYEVLTGAPPFRGESYMETMFKQVNDNPKPYAGTVAEKKIESVVMKALEKKAENRFQSMAELNDDLEIASEGSSWKYLLGSKSLRDAGGRWKRANRGRLFLLNFSIACVILGGILISSVHSALSVWNDLNTDLPDPRERIEASLWPRALLTPIPEKEIGDSDINFSRATSIRRKFYESDPLLGADKYSEALFQRACHYMSLGHYNEAVKDLISVIALRRQLLKDAADRDFQTARASSKLACCLYFRGDANQAERQFIAALPILKQIGSNETLEALSGLSSICIDRNDISGAIRYLRASHQILDSDIQISASRADTFDRWVHVSCLLADCIRLSAPAESLSTIRQDADPLQGARPTGVPAFDQAKSLYLYAIWNCARSKDEHWKDLTESAWCYALLYEKAGISKQCETMFRVALNNSKSMKASDRHGLSAAILRDFSEETAKHDALQSGVIRLQALQEFIKSRSAEREVASN